MNIRAQCVGLSYIPLLNTDFFPHQCRDKVSLQIRERPTFLDKQWLSGCIWTKPLHTLYVFLCSLCDVCITPQAWII